MHRAGDIDQDDGFVRCLRLVHAFGDPRRLHALGVAGPTLSDLAARIAELDATPTSFWNLDGAVATLTPRLSRLARQ